MDSPVYRYASVAGCLIRRLRTIVEYITAVLFAILFISFTLQIFMRFILNSPLNWSEELSVISYIWIVFLACALVLRDDQHVVFNVITQNLPARARHACTLVTAIVLGAIFLAIVYGVYDYVAFMKVETTPALLIRKDYVYSIFVVFVAVIILRCIWTIVASFVALFMHDTYTTLADAFKSCPVREKRS